MVGVWAMTDENLCAEAITNVRRAVTPPRVHVSVLSHSFLVHLGSWQHSLEISVMSQEKEDQNDLVSS